MHVQLNLYEFIQENIIKESDESNYC